jgi:hypothetical protein
MSFRRKSRAEKVLRIVVPLGLLLGLGAWAVLSEFRWLTPSLQTAQGRLSSFFMHWPRSPLEEAAEERKKLRRFAKSEQKRRLGVIARRMEFINGTVADLEGDGSLVLERPLHADLSYRSFAWPIVSASGDEASQFRYVSIPVPGGTVLRRGLYLRAGDELRFGAELTKEPRHLVFYAFPLSGGQIRGTLGKYSFSHNFDEADVQQLKRVSVAVGDVTATQLRLRSVSGEFFFVFPRVTRLDATGRVPVQLGERDPDWQSAGQGDVRSGLGLALESGSQQESGSPPVEPDLLDPMEIVSNRIVPVSGPTVALGYNVLVIRKSKTVLPLEPRTGDAHQFWHQALDLGPVKDVGQIVKGLTHDVPKILRSFGYHNVLFGTSTELKRVANLAGAVEPKTLVPWLSADDAALEERNRVIARQERPVKGLEAIFARKGDNAVSFLDSKDLRQLRDLQSESASLADQELGGVFHEVFTFDHTSYLASLLSAFHVWAGEQWQTRFFHSVDLRPWQQETAFQPLVVGLKSTPSLLFRPGGWRDAARGIMTDDAFNRILESLRARRLTHRTIVVLIEENAPSNELLSGYDTVGDQATASSARILLFVPGLIGRTAAPGPAMAEGDPSQPALGRPSVSERLLSLVGASLDGERAAQGELQSQETRFRMTVLSFSRSCDRMRWSSPTPVRSLNWSGMKVERFVDSSSFDFYPCSLAGSASAQWVEATVDPANDATLPEAQNSPQSRLLEGLTERMRRVGGSELESKEQAKMFAFFEGQNLVAPVEKAVIAQVGGTSFSAAGLDEQKEFLNDPHQKLKERLADLTPDERKDLGFAVLIERVKRVSKQDPESGLDSTE